MTDETSTLERAASLAGYAAFGVVGTAAAALALTSLLTPVQPVVYNAFYLALGPWSATETATVLHLVTAGALAAAVPTLAAAYRNDDPLRALGGGAAIALASLLVVSVVLAFVGYLSFLTVGFAVLVVAVGAFAGFQKYGVSDGATATFAGSLPVLALLLVLLGVGLGWGGGYDVVAEPVEESSVGDSVAEFSQAPEVRADLFAEPDEDGVYRLTLREYGRERQAARALDANGVRCPFVNAPARPVYDRNASFVTEHDGRHYRVSCEAYGD